MSQSDNTSIPPTSPSGTGGFWSNFYANLESTGIPAKKSIFGFILAWCAFFGILFLMPLPDGLSQAGKSTLAVVVWACVIWVSEAIPIGMTGVAIPYPFSHTLANSERAQLSDCYSFHSVVEA